MPKDLDLDFIGEGTDESIDLDFIDKTDAFGEKDEDETLHADNAKITTREKNRIARSFLRRENAAAVYEIPKPGTSIHMVTNGGFSYWDFIPLTADLQGAPIDELILSTWIMSEWNIKELRKMFDIGVLQEAWILTGRYFKVRNAEAYQRLLEATRTYRIRLFSFKNHSKVVLMRTGRQKIIIEGSANMTENTRTENYVVTNDPELYGFHRAWMTGMFPTEKP